MTHEADNRIAAGESPEVAEKMLREVLAEREFEANDLSLLVKNLRNAPVSSWAAY
jgi:hypothetical protein